MTGLRFTAFLLVGFIIMNGAAEIWLVTGVGMGPCASKIELDSAELHDSDHCHPSSEKMIGCENCTDACAGPIGHGCGMHGGQASGALPGFLQWVPLCAGSGDASGSSLPASLDFVFLSPLSSPQNAWIGSSWAPQSFMIHSADLSLAPPSPPPETA